MTQKYFQTLLLTAFLLCISPFAAQAQDTKAKQAYIIDFETGQVLFSKNADTRMPTSSMSKVMTMYMVFDALDQGNIKLDSEFRVSEKAWKKGGSKMFVELGKDIKIKDLMQGVIVQSGNDATIVLAEGISGSEDRFALKMTEKAKELGMENSNFVNASGWPDDRHYSTAKDLSIMAKAMIKNFPEYYKYFSQKEYTYNNIKQQNRNPLLYRDIGADGLKTGHTEAGGYGLIGTATRDDRRVISVLNGMTSESERAEESTRLVNWALDRFTNIIAVKAKANIAEAPVVMGVQKMANVAVSDNIKITVPIAEKDNVTLDLNYKSPLIAPVIAGQKIGTLTVNIPTMESQSYPLYATSNIEELGFFKKTGAKIKQAIFGKL